MSLNYISHLDFPSFFYPQCYFGQPETVCDMFQPQTLNAQFCNYKFILHSLLEYFVLFLSEFHLTDSRLSLQFIKVKIMMNCEPVVPSTHNMQCSLSYFAPMCQQIHWIVLDLEQIPVRSLVVCPQSRTFPYWFLHTECGFSSICALFFRFPNVLSCFS